MNVNSLQNSLIRLQEVFKKYTRFNDIDVGDVDVQCLQRNGQNDQIYQEGDLQLLVCLLLKRYLDQCSTEKIFKKYQQFKNMRSEEIWLYERVFSEECFQHMLIKGEASQQDLQQESPRSQELGQKLNTTFQNTNRMFGFFTYLFLEKECFKNCANIQNRSKRIQILYYVTQTSFQYNYLYGNALWFDCLELQRFFLRMFKYYEIFKDVIALFQYDFNKDCGCKKYSQTNSYCGGRYNSYTHIQNHTYNRAHFCFVVDIFKYIVSQNPNDPTKVLQPYTELLTDDVLTNIFYKKYPHLAAINLYELIIRCPYLIHYHLIHIYSRCVHNDNYIFNFIQVYNPLQNMIIEDDQLLPNEYCLQCQYDILEDEMVQFDCGHQLCQECFIRMFLKEDISYMVSVQCPWCKKETKHVRVFADVDNKKYLLRHLPTPVRLRYVFQNVSYKKLFQMTNIIGLQLLNQKYELTSQNGISSQNELTSQKGILSQKEMYVLTTQTPTNYVPKYILNSDNIRKTYSMDDLCHTYKYE